VERRFETAAETVIGVHRMTYLRTMVAALALLGAAGAAAAEDRRAFDLRCEPGSYLTGFEGRVGDWIDQIQIVCARWDATRAKLDEPVIKNDLVGRSEGGEQRRVDCPVGSLIENTTDIDYARWGDDETLVLHSIHFTCRTPSEPLQSEPGSFGSRSPIKRPNDDERVAQANSCFPGQAATGIEGEHGKFIYNLLLTCGNPPKASPVAATKPTKNAKYSNRAVGGTKRLGDDLVRAGGAQQNTPPPDPVPPKPTATAKNDVNMHAKATGASPIVGMLEQNSTVPVLGHDNEKDWYLVQDDDHPEVTGWVAADHLTITP
jgi:hypothetical protein